MNKCILILLILIKSKNLLLFIDKGKLRYLHKSSVWFLDFFALIVVIPLVRKAPNITALLHWADPLFSKYLIGFKFDEP